MNVIISNAMNIYCIVLVCVLINSPVNAESKALEVSDNSEINDLLNEIYQVYQFSEESIRNREYEIEYHKEILATAMADPRSDQVVDPSEWITQKTKFKFIYDEQGRFYCELKRDYVPPRDTDPIKYISSYDLESNYILTDSSAILKPNDLIKGSLSIDSDKMNPAPEVNPEAYTCAWGISLSQLLESADSKETSIVFSVKTSTDNERCVLVHASEMTEIMGESVETEYVFVLNSDQMYYPSKVEIYENGVLRYSALSEPQYVEEGIWLPKSGKRDIYNPKGNIFQKSKMQVLKVAVNQEYPDDLYVIKPSRGIRVFDARRGRSISYVYGADDIIEDSIDQLVDLAINDKYIDMTGKVGKGKDVEAEIKKNVILLTDKKHTKLGVGECTTENAKATHLLDNKLVWIVGVGCATICAMVGIVMRGRHKQNKQFKILSWFVICFYFLIVNTSDVWAVDLLQKNCGSNCLTVYFKLNDIDVSRREILDLVDSREGVCSLNDLREVAVKKEIYAEGVKVRSLKTIKELGFEAISLVKPKGHTEYDHFILISGFEDGKVKIIDPPYTPYKVSESQLEERMEGTFLLLSKSEINLPEEGGIIVKISAGLLILMVLLVFLRYIGRNSDEQSEAHGSCIWSM